MGKLVLSPGNALDYEHEPPSPDGKTFVCFNALSGDKEMWRAGLADRLKQNGHGWLIYNLRGQSGSDHTIDAFDEAQIVADATALLNHAKPIRPVHVGLSIGGLFALKAHLAAGAARAEALVLINTLRKDSARLQWINDAVVRAAEIGGMDLLKDLYSPMLMNPAWLTQNIASFLGPRDYTGCSGTDPALMLLNAGRTGNWDVPYEQIDVPVLVVSGLQDRVFFDAADVEQLARRIKRAKRVDFADAGHMIPVERPQELADAVLAFATSL